MIAFKITVNGKHYGTCGQKDAQLLMVNLSAVYHGNPNIITNNAGFSTHGISASDKEGFTHQFFWKNLSLSPNDIVQIEVVEAENFDPPFKRVRSDEEVQYTEEEKKEMQSQGQLTRDE